nr:LLM class flavin-dependent oxidoreductase [Kineococcus siccus]
MPRDLPSAQVLPYARRAEELGFDELWVVEDLSFRGGIAQAAAVLASTSRLAVGVGIAPAGARNAAFAAMEAATLAELFPRRTSFGLGHGMPGWMRQVGAWPASPLTLLEEQLRAVRALLHGEHVDVAGRHVQLRDLQLASPPPQPPPVLAGVRGPKSLAVSGRCADGTILAEPVTPEYLAAARAQIGAAGPHTLVAFEVAVVDDDAARARTLVRPALEWAGEPDCAVHIAPSPFAAEFRALRERCATRAEFTAAMPDAWVDELAVVGTPETARARVAQLHAAGADSVVLIPVGADRLAALDDLARLLG